MDLHDLFQSCRRGDLTRVVYLVEQKEIEVNIRDKWDSTPLYYACLCGHYDVVKYLLENGARCEANTFDGERCLYGALNMKIRKLLRTYNVTLQLTRRNCYEDFLLKLLESQEYSDVTFVVHGEQIRAHRCILSARSDYFCEKFQTRWRHRELITIAHELVRPVAFKAILHYLYTGRLETHKDLAEDCIRLAKQCQLPSLIKQLEDTINKAYSFECTKPGTNVTTIVLEPASGNSDLQQDFGILAEQGMPTQFSGWVGGAELPFSPSVERACFVDLCISVENHIFLCHKAFISARSDYMKALLRDHFNETAVDSERDVPIITLRNIKAEIFAQIMYYSYQNSAELTIHNVYDVLTAADMFLLMDLKRQCAAFLCQCIEMHNVLDLFRLSRMFELRRLEDQCTEVIAMHIDEMVGDEALHEIILDDAKQVVSRQETDTISIIDDIRYHITSTVQTYSAVEEAQEKLRLIDELLENLGLDA